MSNFSRNFIIFLFLETFNYVPKFTKCQKSLKTFKILSFLSDTIDLTDDKNLKSDILMKKSQSIFIPIDVTAV